MRMPVTAITIFLPIVEAQKLGARLSPRLSVVNAASVLILVFPMPQEVPEPNLAQLFIIGARSKQRQGSGAPERRITQTIAVMRETLLHGGYRPTAFDRRVPPWSVRA